MPSWKGSRSLPSGDNGYAKDPEENRTRKNFVPLSESTDDLRQDYNLAHSVIISRDTSEQSNDVEMTRMNPAPSNRINVRDEVNVAWN